VPIHSFVSELAVLEQRENPTNLLEQLEDLCHFSRLGLLGLPRRRHHHYCMLQAASSYDCRRKAFVFV